MGRLRLPTPRGDSTLHIMHENAERARCASRSVARESMYQGHVAQRAHTLHLRSQTPGSMERTLPAYMLQATSAAVLERHEARRRRELDTICSDAANLSSSLQVGDSRDYDDSMRRSREAAEEPLELPRLPVRITTSRLSTHPVAQQMSEDTFYNNLRTVTTTSRETAFNCRMPPVTPISFAVQNSVDRVHGGYVSPPRSAWESAQLRWNRACVLDPPDSYRLPAGYMRGMDHIRNRTFRVADPVFVDQVNYDQVPDGD